LLPVSGSCRPAAGRGFPAGVLARLPTSDSLRHRDLNSDLL
jgi:hypothetical protein